MGLQIRRACIAAGIFSTLFVGTFPGNQAFAATDRYTVQPGDSLWKISVKYHVGWPEIYQANKSQIKNPALIYPGQVLSIPIVSTTVTSYEQQVFTLCNQIRRQNGLPALTMNWQLERMARIKSQDMRDKHYFSHQSPTYGSPFTMMKSFGIYFTYAGENIAAGQPDPKSVVNSWMASPGHRANILNKNYTQIGVGYASGGSYGTYWTEDFIRP
jgi:uncharacterized YkwD family protein/spore coat assembly protein SafA